MASPSLVLQVSSARDYTPRMITRTSIRSRLVALCLLLLAAAGLAVPGAASAQALRGSFFGVDAADGARLTIDRGGSGRLSDPGGRSFDFEGERSDGGISGQMPIAGGDALFRVDPLPYGALMTVIPLAADGSQRTDAAQVYTFVRRDLEVPALPEGFLPPPGEGVERFGALGFLRSYQFWAPDGVARGYAAMAPRHRRLVMLFPVVQLDIIWKLCLAPAGLPMVDRDRRSAHPGRPSPATA
ncbi:MAG: hypothetical protein AAFR52_09155, partial [Pseudomonadota bacterium]